MTPSWSTSAPVHPAPDRAPEPSQFAGSPGYWAAAPPAPVEYASWGTRVLARLVDSLIGQALPLAVVGGGLGLDQLGSPDHLGPNKHNAALQNIGLTLAAVGFVCFFLVPVWNFWYREGIKGSLGKSLMGIQVVNRSNGRRIGVGGAIGRDILQIVNCLPFYLGFLWPLWDANNQTLTDKVVSTVVVKKRPRSFRPQTPQNY